MLVAAGCVIRNRWAHKKLDDLQKGMKKHREKSSDLGICRFEKGKGFSNPNSNRNV